MNLYLVSNNLVQNDLIYKSNDSLESKREKRPLSIEGEQSAKQLCQIIDEDINVIYSSCYSSAVATSKYIANKFELPINIENGLNERKIGALEDKTLRFFKETQEHDFNYRLSGGESLNDTKNRITKMINKLIKENKEHNILIVTHSAAIMCYLLNFCEKGFNLDDRLILNFNETVIMDGTNSGLEIYKLELNDEQVENITKL